MARRSSSQPGCAESSKVSPPALTTRIPEPGATMRHTHFLNAKAVVLVCCVIPALALADIYTWVDENGVTHYSTIRPAGSQPQVYPTDPAFRTAPPAPSNSNGALLPRPSADNTADSQALRGRVELLEALLDQERNARITDLKSQLDSERDRVKQLEAEQAQWADLASPWWSAPTTFSGGWVIPTSPVIVGPGHGRPAKSGKPGHIRIKPDSARLPYPSLSGPSAEFSSPSRR